MPGDLSFRRALALGLVLFVAVADAVPLRMLTGLAPLPSDPYSTPYHGPTQDIQHPGSNPAPGFLPQPLEGHSGDPITTLGPHTPTHTGLSASGQPVTHPATHPTVKGPSDYIAIDPLVKTTHPGQTAPLDPVYPYINPTIHYPGQTAPLDPTTPKIHTTTNAKPTGVPYTGQTAPLDPVYPYINPTIHHPGQTAPLDPTTPQIHTTTNAKPTGVAYTGQTAPLDPVYPYINPAIKYPGQTAPLDPTNPQIHRAASPKPTGASKPTAFTLSSDPYATPYHGPTQDTQHPGSNPAPGFLPQPLEGHSGDPSQTLGPHTPTHTGLSATGQPVTHPATHPTVTTPKKPAATAFTLSSDPYATPYNGPTQDTQHPGSNPAPGFLPQPLEGHSGDPSQTLGPHTPTHTGLSASGQPVTHPTTMG